MELSVRGWFSASSGLSLVRQHWSGERKMSRTVSVQRVCCSIRCSEINDVQCVVAFCFSLYISSVLKPYIGWGNIHKLGVIDKVLGSNKDQLRQTEGKWYLNDPLGHCRTLFLFVRLSLTAISRFLPPPHILECFFFPSRGHMLSRCGSSPYLIRWESLDALWANEATKQWEIIWFFD